MADLNKEAASPMFDWEDKSPEEILSLEGFDMSPEEWEAYLEWGRLCMGDIEDQWRRESAISHEEGIKTKHRPGWSKKVKHD